MSLLYLTADQLGIETGGGKVTANEALALREFAGGCEALKGTPPPWVKTISRPELEEAIRNRPNPPPDPWCWDDAAWTLFGNSVKLCHGYAGCFPEAVRKLKSNGAKICWTVAAHDVELSRKAHLDLGLEFPYRHLNNPGLFKQYTDGYRQADVLIAPGKAPMETLRRQGMTQPIEIIPHGVYIKACSACHSTEIEGGCDHCGGSRYEPPPPLPKGFVVGYMGSCGGADKGVRYLLEAWKKLNYKDAVLVLAGKDSQSEWVRHLIQRYGGGTIVTTGWVDDPAKFYSSIGVYVQPSVTEGFGMEVTEAMAFGRPVICSTNAGASDLVNEPHTYQFDCVDGLVNLIEAFKNSRELCESWGREYWEKVQAYSWENVRKQYQQVWKGLLK